MSNPTKKECSNDIVQIKMGDFRPRKALYENVQDNNKFRLYLQQNALKLMNENLKNVEGEVKCCAVESQPKEIKPFQCLNEKSTIPENSAPINKEEEKKEKEMNFLDLAFSTFKF